ncbi:hypothetical protein EAH_00060200 [Eimeria acervulina]|uniref:Uncharacterized protein n=1 Tax=Eimeria acervulina TaxID=5801 RepID=U6GM62_EIMAC|nr:hypothetical protein EAH_00060200 [Eimeria acervulina]CDI81270.1 hypothetical protein EAH_00060200 [Eimeria acervulina]
MAIGAPIPYDAGLHPAHYYEGNERLGHIAQSKEREAAASPAAHATPQAHMRGSDGQQKMHNPASATAEMTARARTGDTETAAPATATTTARTQRKEEE